MTPKGMSRNLGISVMVVRLGWLGWVCLWLWCRPAGGHGRLVEPPSRASAWRFGFPTPHNYNDHELYCGGFSRQWSKNGGNCGVCGDAWDQKAPRPHEYGGRFGQGLTVRRYLRGSVITLRVELTANHNGYFEFRICPDMLNTTQDCLDKYLLRLHDPLAKAAEVKTRFYPKDGNKIYEMLYELPKDLECEHCVVQWRYIAGNNWGTCPDGTGAVGCGNQEEFRACADVAIGLTGESIIPPLAPVTPRPRPPYVMPTRRPTTATSSAVPAEGTPTESPMPEEPHSSWAGLVICVIMLCAVVVSLALFYFYHYRGGHRIKRLLLERASRKPAAPPAPPAPPAAPVRPPRSRKPHNNETGEVDTDKMEAGFENVKLNENRI